MIDLKPGSPEWCRRVSPSKVAAILGVSPWDSQRAMYHKMRGEVPWDDETPAMERGTLCEPAVLAWWRKHHEHEGWEDQPSWTLGDWCVATPDAITRAGGDEVLIEAKTAANLDDWGTPGTDEIPTYYLTQVYFAMEVAHRAGRPVARCHVPVLGGYRLLFDSYVVEYDPAIGADLFGRMETWAANLADGEPPPLDDSIATFDTMRQLHKDIDKGESVELTEAEARALVMSRVEMDRADAAVRLARSTVLDRMGRAQYATHDGVRIARRQSRGPDATSFVVVAKPNDLPDSESETAA